jgi:hypothetical protein
MGESFAERDQTLCVRVGERGCQLLALLLALALGLLITGSTATAGETDPTLALYDGRQAPGISGTMLRVEGVFPWNALLQSGYPLELVLWAADGGGDFLRVRLDGEMRRGRAPFVVDGLTPGEAVSLASIGAADGGHRLTYVAEGRIDLLVTGVFAGRPLAAQLVVLDEGTPFVSNVIRLEAD